MLRAPCAGSSPTPTKQPYPGLLGVSGVFDHIAGLPQVPCYSSDARGVAPPCECAKQCDRHGLSHHTAACLLPVSQLANRTDRALFEVREPSPSYFSVP